MSHCSNATYAKAEGFTPLLATSDWKSVFTERALPLDDQGLLRKIETIAFPDTVFVVEEMLDNMCKVSTSEYPDKVWADARFLEIRDKEFSPRRLRCPPPSRVLQFLHERVHEQVAYIWGGNAYQGIPKLLELYPPAIMPPIGSLEYKRRILQGVDCSGLLFEATGGFTPRNTSQLLKWGESVPIADLPLKSFLKRLQPLDLIVWKGHVVIVADEKNCIESRNPEGVIQTPLQERFDEILRTRSALNEWQDGDHFIIRRWAHQV